MHRSANPFSEQRRRVSKSELPHSDGALGLKWKSLPSFSGPAPNFDLLNHVTTSVLIGTHNDAAFVECCIESLLVQSVLPNEIIVYDCGSTDDTIAKLRRYGSRITLIETSTASFSNGRGSLMQAAFKLSTGNLIFLLSGHDRFKRDKIESYVAVFTANRDAALIQSPMDKIDEHGRVIGQHFEPRKHVVEHLKEIQRNQDVDFYYPGSALAFSRHYWEASLPTSLVTELPLSTESQMCVVAPYFGRVITLPQTLTEWRRGRRGKNSRLHFSRTFHLRQTLLRAKVFNQFCERHGLPSISPWKNFRFYLQLLRCSLPDAAYRAFHRSVRERSRR